MKSGEHARPPWALNLTWACKLGCMHAICLRTKAHISDNLGWIRKLEICTELERHAGHDYDVWAHAHKHARMLACLHTVFWRALAHISTKSDQRYQSIYRIRRTFWTFLSTVSSERASFCACMLCACVHRPIFQPDWVWLERSRILWNQNNMPDLSEHISHPKHTSQHSYTLYLHAQAHISAINSLK